MKFMDILDEAREAELCAAAALEHIERLQRIARHAGHSLEYAQELTEKITQSSRDLDKEVDKAVDARTAALEVMRPLKGAQRAVIYRYYILGQNWRNIAQELFYSERHVYELRKSAVEKMEKYWEFKHLKIFFDRCEDETEEVI